MKKTEKTQKAPTRLSRNAKKWGEGNPTCPPHILEDDRLFRMVEPLVLWYAENARPLPWREGREPYRVWLSEIMLQQTRIEAVRPYYARFLEEAPTVAALAALPDDRLMKLWQGLGYYSRARNLKRAAIAIVERYGGELPADHAALLSLPGIGEYTAGAIASIAFGLPVPAVDGNVLRVLARLTGDRDDILALTTKKRVTEQLSLVYASVAVDAALRKKLAARAPTLSVPAALTEGLMELGQTLCAPNRAPLCEHCPLADLCAVKRSGEWESIPYRAKKKARKEERRLVLLLSDGSGRFALRRRPSTGLLADLWELPSIPLASTVGVDDATLDCLARTFCCEHGLIATESVAAPDARHIFTHIEWQMKGRYLNVICTEDVDPSLVFASPREIRTTYALPSAFASYLTLIHGIE